MAHPPLPSRRPVPPTPSEPVKTLYQESIELQDLSSSSFPPETSVSDDTISLWAYTTAGGLVFLSFPLLFFPRLVFFLLGSLELNGQGTGKRREVVGDGLTGLESFLCQQLGILMWTLAFLILLLTAPPPPHVDAPSPTSFPKSNKPSRSISAFHSKRPTTVFVLTPAFLISSATSYYTSLGSLSVFFSVVTAVIGLWGCWVCMFNDEPGHFSKTTGSDKRTSGFPFKNRNDADEIKKRFREGGSK
ncbi:hypothetical protein BDY24DRAFT_376813 [Mrakia frigida]|uniref:uncharacterized protein n=1 Tax=Mrakia frigida TaxID=29902 RepID=UPI003FCC00F7